MGQYRQWLHYREINQLLNAQIITLEKELVKLNERIDAVAQETSLTADNAILQVLIQQQQETQPTTILNAPTEKKGTAPSPDEHVPSAPSPETKNAATGPDERVGSVSPALFAWSRLPNFGSQDLLQTPLHAVPAPYPIPSTLQPDEDSLPEDMTAFVNSYGRTAPQLELPRWLRAITNAQTDADTQNTGPSGPIDVQSNRTNQLVQRWFERRERFAQIIQERREQNKE